MKDGQWLTDSHLAESFRASNIADAYQFKNEILRQTATMDFPAQMGRGGQALKSRGNFPSYLRTIDRELRSGFSENRALWGPSDRYGHTLRTP